ncbi:MAG: 3'-5' exonuclease domain-containing protein 2 [Bdellovibrionaceae bacterium]|nr:3'-5' exonuclease domain-containing protein 2 [Pseudobdellovibrionaceae bacterium]
MPQEPISYIQFPGKIHLITSDEQCAAVLQHLNSTRELGFDTETRPSFKKGEWYDVALLQLATDTDAYLFRLHRLSQFEIFKNILENAEILKVGAAVRDDLKALQKRFAFVPKNVIELQDVAKAKNLKNMGLKGMAEEVLGLPLSKRAKITNWEAPHLTEAQLMYAATDAWVGLHLYRKITS